MQTMSDPFVPRVGGILSADIAVPEHEREVRFYSRVLTTGEHPLWREDLMNNLGTPIVGLGPRSAEYDHLPLQWMPHIQVADVAASVKHALDLGGKGLMLDEKNQWAVLLDPNGVTFGIIPVVPADAVPPTDSPAAHAGHISWLNLTVADAPAARDFYTKVVGWSVQEVGMEDAGEIGGCSIPGQQPVEGSQRHVRAVCMARYPPATGLGGGVTRTRDKRIDCAGRI